MQHRHCKLLLRNAKEIKLTAWRRELEDTFSLVVTVAKNCRERQKLANKAGNGQYDKFSRDTTSRMTRLHRAYVSICVKCKKLTSRKVIKFCRCEVLLKMSACLFP